MKCESPNLYIELALIKWIGHELIFDIEDDLNHFMINIVDALYDVDHEERDRIEAYARQWITDYARQQSRCEELCAILPTI